ncbi:Peroxiredoxin [hydrothermal vent metagenome]|uniref:Peroxiredoxin n=1 Tax=hydrothermal vent metagenome TaxID=652676 RepID=A0A3B0REG8_9ZZZZ
MTISVGDRLPDTTFMTMTSEGPSPVSTADIFAGKKVVLFALPGAFTPTCHKTHFPDFVSNADTIKAKGVDTIVCLSVNDVFVMSAWGQQVSPDGKILMLADGNGDFAKATGTDLDASGFGMGLRCQRYSMIVDDGVVSAFNIGDKSGEAEISSADTVLKQL